MPMTTRLMISPPGINLSLDALLQNPPEIPRPVQWRLLDGVVLLDKPVGLTSNQALQAVRRLFGASKGGHTGTLDPFATGVLPLCLGEATKFSADLLNADKCYVASVCFGARTDTGDLTGRMVESTDHLPGIDAIEDILSCFEGESEQIPPMYSALKRDGQPLYKLARAGIEVERQPRKIHLSELGWSNIVLNDQGAVITADLSVRCSKGTYIRTLAEDIARAVGSQAHLIALRRTQVGDVSLNGCKTLEQLVAEAIAINPEPSTISAASLCDAGLLQPADFLVQNLQRLDITERQAVLCGHGNPFRPEVGQTFPEGSSLRFYRDGRFIGVGQVATDGKDLKIQPVRLVSTENP
jgi:tRNA pseudouridine55 synthase